MEGGQGWGRKTGEGLGDGSTADHGSRYEALHIATVMLNSWTLYLIMCGHELCEIFNEYCSFQQRKIISGIIYPKKPM